MEGTTMLRTLAAFLLFLPILTGVREERGVMTGPTQFDVDLYGNIYLLDGQQNMLRVLSPKNTLLYEVGGAGWANDQFDRPGGIWARNGIDVYVADYGNHRIQRFDRGLAYVSTFSTRDGDVPEERFGYPTDMALSRLGELFICDGENVRVLKVNSASKVERSIGDYRAGKGRLRQPTQIEIGPRDQILVLDGSRVVIFDTFGTYLGDLLEGVLRSPTVIFADERSAAVLEGATLFCLDEHFRPLITIAVDSLVGHSTVRGVSFAGTAMYLLTGDGVKAVPDPRQLDKE
jgi:DNA-binding beta-propeller fold protein YncE